MMSNKVSCRYSKKEPFDEQDQKILQSPIKSMNNSIKLNLSSLVRSTSQQIGKPFQNKFLPRQKMFSGEKKKIIEDIANREANLCKDEIQSLNSNIRNLLGSSLSIRSSHSNQLFSARLAENSNWNIESPKIKGSHQFFPQQTFRGKENNQKTEIELQMKEMKVNYIKSSLALNQQLNNNTKLLQCIEELKEQQNHLAQTYQSSKSQSLHSTEKQNYNQRYNNIKGCLKIEKQKSKSKINSETNLIEVIARQQSIIKELQSLLKKEKLEKEQIISQIDSIYLHSSQARLIQCHRSNDKSLPYQQYCQDIQLSHLIE